LSTDQFQSKDQYIILCSHNLLPASLIILKIQQKTMNQDRVIYRVQNTDLSLAMGGINTNDQKYFTYGRLSFLYYL